MIKASHYAETEAKLAENPIVRRMAMQLSWDLRDGKTQIGYFAFRGANGEVTPKSQFMNNCNTQFHKMEELNPDYKHEGPLHIGAVASVILADLRKTYEIMVKFTEDEMVEKMEAADIGDVPQFRAMRDALAPMFGPQN